eukprot:jgi/Chlat1/7434/Chrsp6S07443
MALVLYATLDPMLRSIMNLISEAQNATGACKAHHGAVCQLASRIQSLEPVLKQITAKSSGAQAGDAAGGQRMLERLHEVLQEAQDLLNKCTKYSRLKLILKSKELGIRFSMVSSQIDRCLHNFTLYQTLVSGEALLVIQDIRRQLQQDVVRVANMTESVPQDMQQQLADLSNARMTSGQRQLVLENLATSLHMPLAEVKSECAALRLELQSLQSKKSGQDDDNLDEQMAALVMALSSTSVGNTAALSVDVNLLSSQRTASSIPEDLICPLCDELMYDPVVVSESGHLYDRACIQRQFEQGSRICPLSSTPLEELNLVSVIRYRERCRDCAEALDIAFPSEHHKPVASGRHHRSRSDGVDVPAGSLSPRRTLADAHSELHLEHHEAVSPDGRFGVGVGSPTYIGALRGRLGMVPNTRGLAHVRSEPDLTNLPAMHARAGPVYANTRQEAGNVGMGGYVQPDHYSPRGAPAPAMNMSGLSRVSFDMVRGRSELHASGFEQASVGGVQVKMIAQVGGHGSQQFCLQLPNGTMVTCVMLEFNASVLSVIGHHCVVELFVDASSVRTAVVAAPLVSSTGDTTLPGMARLFVRGELLSVQAEGKLLLLDAGIEIASTCGNRHPGSFADGDWLEVEGIPSFRLLRPMATISSPKPMSRPRRASTNTAPDLGGWGVNIGQALSTPSPPFMASPMHSPIARPRMSSPLSSAQLDPFDVRLLALRNSAQQGANMSAFDVAQSGSQRPSTNFASSSSSSTGSPHDFSFASTTQWRMSSTVPRGSSSDSTNSAQGTPSMSGLVASPVWRPSGLGSGSSGTLDNNALALPMAMQGGLLRCAVWDQVGLRWQFADEAPVAQLEGHTSAVTALIATKWTLYSGSKDGSIRMWGTGDFVSKGVLRGHGSPVTALCLGMDFLISAAEDGKIKFWKLDDNDCAHTFKAHSCKVTAIAASGDMLYTAAVDGVIKEWRLSAGWLGFGKQTKCVRKVQGHRNSVSAVATCGNRNNNWLFTASVFGSIKPWHLPDLQPLQCEMRHFRAVSMLRCDNDMLFSSAADHTVKTWGLPEMNCIYTLQGYSNEFLATVQFGPYVCTSSADENCIRVWQR